MANSQKPDNVLKLAGTYRKDRHGDPDAKPAWSDDAPEMPEFLDDDDYAQKEWLRVLRDAPPGVITKTDCMVFAQYCMLCSKLAEQKHKFTSADHTQLKLIQQQLGFTPATRGKIVGRPINPDDSGWQSLPK